MEQLAASSLLYAVLALCVTLLLFIALRREKLPPGVKLPPRVTHPDGKMALFSAYNCETQHLFLRECVEKYGPVFSLNFGIAEIIVLVEGDDVRKVLEVAPKSKVYNLFNRVALGQPNTFVMLGLDEKTTWRRKHVRHAFSISAMRSSFHIVRSTLERLSSRFSAIAAGGGGPVDVLHLIEASAADVIGIILTGSSLGALDDAEPGRTIMRSIEPILKEFIVNSRVAFWRNLLPPLLLPERARANRLARELMDICGALVRRAREQRERGELPQDCMLQSLLTLEDLQTGKPLSDEEIFSEFHMYLIAGMDTTSGTIAWALYAVSQHPDVEARVVAELDKLLGPPGPKAAPLTYDSLGQMPYLSAVLRESMRRFPVAASGFFREPSSDVVTPSGYLLKKGSMVEMPCYSMNTASGFKGAFDRPLEFLPDRWIEGSPIEVKEVPRQFLPFSFGCRDCPGRSLALMEAKATLATLLHRFRFRMPAGSAPLEGKQVLILQPEMKEVGLRMHVESRMIA